MTPILCSTDEVRAILEGWKVVKRLAMRPQPESVHPGVWRWGACQWTDDPLTFYASGIDDDAPCQPGDVLYVREGWKERPGGGYIYKADTLHPHVTEKILWRPAVHMPKEAARIFLRVTDVRAERLQDDFTGSICPLVNFEVEGIDVTERFCRKCKAPCQQCVEHYGEFCPVDAASTTAGVLECGMLGCLREKYAKIWNRTIKRKDRGRYGWAANPFVWFVVFEKMSKEEMG